MIWILLLITLDDRFLTVEINRDAMLYSTKEECEASRYRNYHTLRKEHDKVYINCVPRKVVK